jgi:hypothetical protein
MPVFCLLMPVNACCACFLPVANLMNKNGYFVVLSKTGTTGM